MDNKDQGYLYHYTNVSSLALILKNQNIKFNPLTVLDDAEEQKIKDRQQHLGKYCFVSSWTNDETESIPMWNMYTNIAEGVRIRLPKNPFKEYLLNEAAFRKVLGNDGYDISGQGYYTVVPPEEIFGTNYFIPTHVQKHLLKQVKYSDNKDYLCPQIISIENENTNMNMGSLGIFKNTYWSFQNEWRYLLIMYPFGYKEMSEDAISNGNKNILMKLYRGDDLPFNFYFLKLDPIKFEDMQITLSPKINEGNKQIAKLLVKKYNPKATIKESDLYNRLK